MYYVDREGFLLDSQNRYIVDAKGMQIKLEPTHLNLLKEHNVFS
jgi:flagellar basal body rod protein FlgG